jgi:hypothetical protein
MAAPVWSAARPKVEVRIPDGPTSRTNKDSLAFSLDAARALP